jgi:hypothetical protein
MNDNEHSTPIELEVVPLTAIEAITRAEVDIQISTAKKYPRVLSEFKRRALAMVTLDEETAASCLFRLTRKSKDGIKVIEGESIRMAEIVAATYGNMRSAAQIVEQTPRYVKVRAVSHDLETNNLIAVEKMARTTYKDGQPYNDDMAIMIANATISKALRDAIFRVVPRSMIRSITDEARKVAIGTAATLAARRSKAVVWARSLKIDMARVWAVLEVKGEEDIGLDQLEALTGLRTAIRDGEQTVDDTFPAIADTPNLAYQQSPSTSEQSAPIASNVTPLPAEAPKRRGRPPKVESEPQPDQGIEVGPVETGSEAEVPMQAESQVPPTIAVGTLPPSTPGSSLAHQRLYSFLTDNGIDWDTFSGWLRTTGRAPEPPNGLDEMSDKLADAVARDTKGLAKCATLYATKAPHQNGGAK